MTAQQVREMARAASGILASVGRIVSVLGGLAAFGYGAIIAVGYSAPVSTGVRLGRLEARTVAIDSESRSRDSLIRFNIAGLQRGQDSISRRIDGLTRVSCLNLKAEIRIYLSDCSTRLIR